jgi:hypothetical protein
MKWGSEKYERETEREREKEREREMIDEMCKVAESISGNTAGN